MRDSLRFLLISSLFIFLIFGEVISPIEAQQGSVSLEESTIFVGGENKPKKILYVTVTGYTSLPELTDEDPWITAAQTIAREGIAASNCLPFGTVIRIPKLFGDKEFIIEDRLNSRFTDCRIDIWLPTYWDAVEFGIHHNTLIEIIR